MITRIFYISLLIFGVSLHAKELQCTQISIKKWDTGETIQYSSEESKKLWHFKMNITPSVLTIDGPNNQIEHFKYTKTNGIQREYFSKNNYRIKTTPKKDLPSIYLLEMKKEGVYYTIILDCI